MALYVSHRGSAVKDDEYPTLINDLAVRLLNDVLRCQPLCVDKTEPWSAAILPSLRQLNGRVFVIIICYNFIKH